MQKGPILVPCISANWQSGWCRWLWEQVRVSNGLKQSKWKTRAAQYCSFRHSPLPAKWRFEGIMGRRNFLLHQSIRLGDIPWEPGCHWFQQGWDPSFFLSPDGSEKPGSIHNPPAPQSKCSEGRSKPPALSTLGSVPASQNWFWGQWEVHLGPQERGTYPSN